MKKILSFSLIFFLWLATNAQEKNSTYLPAALFSPQYNDRGSTLTRGADGSPNVGYWQNKVDYDIAVALNEIENAVSGKVTVTYTNNSPLPLGFLWMQLDQNLFKSDSRGQTRLQAGMQSRYGDPNKPFDGGYKISSIKNEKGNVLKYTITDTRMQLVLDKPLNKGESLKYTIDYSYNIPQYGADRTGILDTKNGKVYAIAQWYPRMCVYDDIVGWNVEPYLGPGEFYCEFGDFKVSITAPASHLVAAGGELLNAKEVLTAGELTKFNQAKGSDATVMIRSKNDLEITSKFTGTKTWKFRLENARDFAWTSSMAFIWDAAKINLPGGKNAMAQSVYPEESEGKNAWSRSTEFTKGSVENYSKRWYPYPYPVAINVASNISGMEYPAIVFCGYKASGEGLWGVTDHEFAHTWFPMIVGSNERRYGWMDEGFATFMGKIANEDFNNGEFKENPTAGDWVGRYMFGNQTEGMMLTPEGMKELSIGNGLYAKPGYALEVLRNYVLGDERFDFAFRTYIRRWAFKHPTPEDFFRTMNNAAGENLDWFWRGWFINNYKLDQAIGSVTFNEKEKYTTVQLLNLDQMAMPIFLNYETVSGQKGTKSLPVEIWTNTHSFRLRIAAGEELKSVTIDEAKVLPDMDFKNNSWQKAN